MPVAAGGNTDRYHNRLTNPVMSDSPPITRSTLTVPEPILREWASKSRKILVRSEYEETEEAANSAHDQGKDAFVVAGQPGIGVPPSHSIIRRIRLTLNQESPSSYCTFLHAVSPLGSPQLCKPVKTTRFSSMKAVSPNSVI